MSEIAQYPLAIKGLDTRKLLVDPDRANNMQNLLSLDGILSRCGNTRFHITRLSEGDKISGLHRFYRNADVPQTIATSGTKVAFQEDADSGWTIIESGRVQVDPTYFVTWLGRVYITDGVNRPISWDGTAKTFEDFQDTTFVPTQTTQTSFTVVGDKSLEFLVGRKIRVTDGIGTFEVVVVSSVFSSPNTTVVITNGVIDASLSLVEWVGLPIDTVQLIPYQDRLVGFTKNSGALGWTESFRTNRWFDETSTNVQPDTKILGLSIRSQNQSTFGAQSGVLIAGEHGLYLFAGTDLRVPFTTGNYTIADLTDSVITASPLSITWSPKGTLLLGADKQIYLVPFVGLTTKEAIPIPIGHRVQESNDWVGGLKDIPDGQISKAVACYHNGFYKISYSSAGSVINDLQLWLHIDALDGTADDFGPWYGPMKGHSFSCLEPLRSQMDSGRLIGGLDNESDILELNKEGLSSDFSTNQSLYNDGSLYGSKHFLDEGTKDIFTVYKTFHHPLNTSIGFNKDISNIEFELRDIQQRSTFTLYDIERIIGVADLIAIVGPDARCRIKNSYNARNLSIEIKWNSQDFQFRLLGILVENVLRNLPLEEI